MTGLLSHSFQKILETAMPMSIKIWREVPNETVRQAVLSKYRDPLKEQIYNRLLSEMVFYLRCVVSEEGEVLTEPRVYLVQSQSLVRRVHYRLQTVNYKRVSETLRSIVRTKHLKFVNQWSHDHVTVLGYQFHDKFFVQMTSVIISTTKTAWFLKG